MTGTGDFTHAETPVCVPGVGRAAFAAPAVMTISATTTLGAPPRPRSLLDDLIDRIAALEAHAAALAKDCEALKRNDVRQAQEITALKQRLDGTGGRAYETNADVW